jgi:RHS repeat-associated protein
LIQLLVLGSLWICGTALAAEETIDTNLSAPSWTHGQLKSDNGMYTLTWSDLNEDRVDYYLITESGPKASREFRIARVSFLSDQPQASFVKGAKGVFSYQIQACYREIEETGLCSQKSDSFRIRVNAPYQMPAGLVQESEELSSPIQAFSASEVVGGPDDLSPGAWYNPNKDGHGWNFYWVSNLRFPPTPPPGEGLHSNTYGLIGYWYTYRNFGTSSQPNWQPVFFVAVLSESNSDFEGSLIYQERNHSTGEMTQHIVGSITVALGSNNRSIQVDWSVSGIHPCHESDLDSFGECSLSETLGYLGDNPALGFGTGTSPIDHYEGWWWRFDEDASGNKTLDESFALIQWMEDELEYSLVSMYDANGQPSWVSGIQTGFAPGNGYTTKASTEFCYSYVQNGYSAAQNEPAGRNGNSEVSTGCGTREFKEADLCIDGFNQRFNRGLLYLDLTLPSSRSGSLLVEDSPGTPSDIEKASNFHSVIYNYNEQGPSENTCNLLATGQCDLELTFFTDGDYPDATLYMKKYRYSGSFLVHQMTEPSVEGLPYTLNDRGKYHFELHRENSINSPMIAKSCTFEVERQPFPNTPNMLTASWTDKAKLAYSVQWNLEDTCTHYTSWNSCGESNLDHYEIQETNPAGLISVFNTSNISSYNFTYTTGPGGDYHYQVRACFSSACSDWSDTLVWNVPHESITYYHVDALGSVVAATDEAGDLLFQEHYDPYGARIFGSASETNSLWYTGKEFDEDTGLTYLGSRWYDPRVGRTLGVDPANVSAEPINSFNRYAYADNNPYRYIDPDGEIAFVPLIIWGVSAAITAYDTYSTYQEQGAEAAAKGLAKEAVLSVIPGGKILSKSVGVAKNLRKSANAAEDLVVVTKGAGKNVKEGIYEFTDTAGKKYCGQSCNIPNRLNQHIKSGKLDPNQSVTTTEVLGGKTAREIAEHKRIQEITGGVPARRSSRVSNKVDPIGPKRRHLLDD